MGEESRKLPKEAWKRNDYYKRRMSYGSIVTRSQTPFNRIENSNSDMEFFSNGVLHHPSTKPHLIVGMVGEYGAIPRTIVTRSAATKLKQDKALVKVVKQYKDLAKKDPLIMELKEVQKENPNLLNPEAAVIEVPEDAVSEAEEQSSAEDKTSGSGYDSELGLTTEESDLSSS